MSKAHPVFVAGLVEAGLGFSEVSDPGYNVRWGSATSPYNRSGYSVRSVVKPIGEI